MHFRFLGSHLHAPSLAPEEWLETNGLGDYASSTVSFCNSRKYHGLFVADVPSAGGRHVLLSTLEESVVLARRVLDISSRVHPGGIYPHGVSTLREVEISAYPRFVYTDKADKMLVITREIMLVRNRPLLLVRYVLDEKIDGEDTQAMLYVKPLLAYRLFHALGKVNAHVETRTTPLPGGASVRLYPSLPTLHVTMQAPGVTATFQEAPDWYYNVQYPEEARRGFESSEDLFKPGEFSLPVKPGQSAILAVSTETLPELDHAQNAYAALNHVWRLEAESRCREPKWAELGVRVTGVDSFEGEDATSPERLFTTSKVLPKLPVAMASVERQLLAEAGRFFVRDREGVPAVLAGYHWFDAWGRDTLIALPGLACNAELLKPALEVLAFLASQERDGLIPNIAGHGVTPPAYNCVDASLWFVLAVQRFMLSGHLDAATVKRTYWPVVKRIVKAYSGASQVPGVKSMPHMDAQGFLHMGTPETQLTWMDAKVNGRPVTPRHGCPVEIAALWYNALCFATELAREFKDTRNRRSQAFLDAIRMEFLKRFLCRSTDRIFLADVWREASHGGQDKSLRPNQLFAISLPYPILEKDYWPAVLDTCREALLTPFGLRTLSSDNPAYCPVYSGGPEKRDGAYHQGTVWPWLLGPYTEALLKTAEGAKGRERAARELLEAVTPLFTRHLREHGVGSMSEIFGGDEPHAPDGCIAQAWSVGEALRMLTMIRREAPCAYVEWTARSDSPNGEASCAS